MRSSPFTIILALSLTTSSLLLCPRTARAEPETPAVVRHRLFVNDGNFELSLALGATPVTYLTRHLMLDASLGWNVSETWSIQLRGTHAFSGHTQTADDASDMVLSSDPSIRFRHVDDFEDLWELRWSALALGRWMPIYGKFSLFAALPVHFSLYLAAGVGLGGFERGSLVLEDLHESAIKPVFAVALGARLYLTRLISLNIELADRFFPDTYRVEIDRLSQDDTGKEAGSPGLTHLVLISFGIIFSF